MAFEETKTYRGLASVLAASFRAEKSANAASNNGKGKTIEEVTKAELERIRRKEEKGFEIEKEAGTGVFKPLSETKALQLLKMIAGNN